MKKAIFLAMLLACTLGFRVFPGTNTWSISPSDPTLWIQFCSTPTFTDMSFPANDVLHNTNATEAQMVQSILNDYNGIPSFFPQIALYPPDPNNPPAPAPGNSVFTKTKAAVRTIKVCVNNQVLTGGYTQLQYDDNSNITGCSIELASSSIQQAKFFVAILTHEIGHCFGLDHPQDTTQAVMSYFHDADLLRLQSDDKMGLSHQYPANSSWIKETATFGLSCSPNN